MKKKTKITTATAVKLMLTMGLFLFAEDLQTVNAQEQKLIEIKKELAPAVKYSQTSKMIMLRSRMHDLIENDIKDSEEQVIKYGYYYAGYTSYRLASYFPDIGEKQQGQYLDEAIRFLEQAVEIDDEFAEAHALLASCYGMKATGVISGMRYGPRSDSAMKKALGLAPDNPRVVMLDAIGKLFKPSMFGGSVEGAISGFQKAIEHFEAWSPERELDPEWGNLDVYAWLGQAYERDEQRDKARQAYVKALEVNPDYAWVKYQLLPRLEGS